AGGIAAQGSASPAAADDAEQLKQEIERTREQLGATVEQLAAKADVKARARGKAAELAGRMKNTVAGTREQALTRTGNLRGQLAGTAGMARQKAITAGQAGKGQLQQRIAPVREALPDPVGQAVAKGAGTARQHRVPLAVAAAVLIVGLLAFRQWRNR
ncbi:MAG: DUF3618 domain-containing protein, partial [Streptosporangiaceae bacterium]|nr:DUF3618 domain-containing protein [Streptosporangiaceae bacterium]